MGDLFRDFAKSKKPTVRKYTILHNKLKDLIGEEELAQPQLSCKPKKGQRGCGRCHVCRKAQAFDDGVNFYTGRELEGKDLENWMNLQQQKPEETT